MRNPMTVEALVDWLKKQDPLGRYDYDDVCHCLNAQYFTSLGYRKVQVGNQEWRGLDPKGNYIRHPLPDGFNTIALLASTYGGALKAALAWLKDGQITPQFFCAHVARQRAADAYI